MPKQSFSDLTEEQARRIRQAFLDAIYSARNRAQVNAIAEALARGDIEAVIRALALDPAVFRGLERAIEQAFEAGGEWQIDKLLARTTPLGPRVDVLFNVRAYRAESIMREQAGNLIREIVADQVVAARNFIVAGMESGTGPRTVGLDLVGRLNKATGLREGGVLGLTSAQEQWIRNYAAELSDPDLLPQALQRALRDKRFDKTIAAAIRNGKGLDADTIAKLVRSYRNKALKLRGETIGRTEALQSLHQAAFEAMQQAIDAGQVDADLVYGVWFDSRDFRVRDTHQSINKKRVRWGTPWVTSRGNQLRFPGDPNAPAEEVVACRCHALWKVDYIAQAKRDRARAGAFAA